MGAFDVVVLRGICAAHAEQYVLPSLQQVQQAQERLGEQFKKIEERFAQQDAAGTGRLDALTAQVEGLVAKLDSKADAAAVPSLTQFEDITSKFRLEESEKSACDIEAKIREEMAPIFQKLEDLTSMLESKADADSVPGLDMFEEALLHKANAREVPTRADLQKLSGTVERKANLSKVNAQFQELQTVIAGKVDARLVPTIAQVDELASEMKRKANITSIASISQLDKISAELQNKANTADVISVAQVEALLQQKLDIVVAHKAEVDDVPSLAQHRELAAATERKMAFLASKLQQQRADSGVDWCQPVMWCAQPVEVVWDEVNQAWQEWPGPPGTVVAGNNSGSNAPCNVNVNGHTTAIGNAIANGASGVNGAKGANGANGANGTDGVNGVNGLNGANGVNGVNGQHQHLFVPKPNGGQSGQGGRRASRNGRGKQDKNSAPASASQSDTTIGTPPSSEDRP